MILILSHFEYWMNSGLKDSFLFFVIFKMRVPPTEGSPSRRTTKMKQFFFSNFFFRWNFFEIKFGFFLIDSRIFLKPAPDSLTEQLDFFLLLLRLALLFTFYCTAQVFIWAIFFCGWVRELCQKGNLKASDCQFNIRKLLSLVIDRLNKRWISENVNFNFANRSNSIWNCFDR